MEHMVNLPSLNSTFTGSPKCFTCHVIISSYVRFAYRISVFSLINLNSLTLCHTRIRPFKQRYFAGSAKCSKKLLSKLSTCTLSVVESGLQSYCDSSHSRGGLFKFIKENTEMRYANRT
jgi:cytochrome c peroxidase